MRYLVGTVCAWAYLPELSTVSSSSLAVGFGIHYLLFICLCGAYSHKAFDILKKLKSYKSRAISTSIAETVVPLLLLLLLPLALLQVKLATL